MDTKETGLLKQQNQLYMNSQRLRQHVQGLHAVQGEALELKGEVDTRPLP